MHTIVHGAALTVTVEGGPGGISKFFESGDLNHSNESTFCSGGRLEVINITLGSFGLL